MIPLRTDCPLRHTPYMNWALILANFLVFFAQTFISPHGLPANTYWYSPYMLDPRAPILYTYFTYQFLHAGWLHVGENMLFLYIFGNNVNDKLGHLGYLGFYLAGGVFAGITFVLDPHSVAPVLGASGSISAVTGAFLILFPRAKVLVLYIFILIGTIEISSLWFILIFFGLDLVGLSSSGTVAHAAHLGGSVFGVVVNIALLSGGLLPRDQFDMISLLKQWHRRRQYRDAVASGWNPYGAAQTKEPSRPDPLQDRIMDARAEIAEAMAHQQLPRAAELYLALLSLDPRQVLSRQAQLDIANQLAAQQLYTQAAAAYELFLASYPKFEQIEQVELMLGLIYARYLSQADKARHYLTKALARLHSAREIEMAQFELNRLAPAPPPPAGP